MDYEVMYVIAICLIVKIAALSPEFSLGEERENPQQSDSRSGALLEPEATYTGRQQEGFSEWRAGGRKLKHVDTEDGEEIKEKRSFDKCDHKLELLESSLNWRDIRKTLRWLDRILASNQTEHCHRRKNTKRFHGENLTHHPSEKIKKYWKKKKSATRDLNSIRSRKNRKSNKERKHKRRSWKNRLRENRKKKPGQKESKGKKSKSPPGDAPPLEAAILKPNSVLLHVEKMFLQRTKTKNQCEGLDCTGKPTGSSVEAKTSQNGQEKPKQKPWPHFVYHRVSSNFLHPDSTNRNHKQSAYIAISVVTSSKPDSTDNSENT